MNLFALAAAPAMFSGAVQQRSFQRHSYPVKQTPSSDTFIRQHPVKPVQFGTTDLFQPKIDDTIFVVIDLETTGRYPYEWGHRITQISAKKYQNGEQVGELTRYVNPGRKIPKEIQDLTHVTQALADAALPISEVIPELAAFVGEKPLFVAHNAPYDMNFLRATCKDKRNGNLSKYVDLFSKEHVFCTKLLATRVFDEWRQDILLENGRTRKDFPRGARQLGTLTKSIGGSTDGAHQADVDVDMCADLFYAMIQRLRDAGISMTTVQQLRDYLDTPPAILRKRGQVPRTATT